MAGEEFKTYWQQEQPALAEALQTIKEGPAREEMAAGQAAQTGRLAAGAAEDRESEMDAAKGISAGSGSGLLKYGSILSRGAGATAEAATQGRMAARSQTLGETNEVSGIAQGTIARANRLLGEAAGESGAFAEQQSQNSAENAQSLTSALASIGASLQNAE